MSASCNTTALFQSYNMTKMTREQMLFRHDSEEIKRVAFQGHIMPGMGSNRIWYKCIARLAEICVVYSVNPETENENELKCEIMVWMSVVLTISTNTGEGHRIIGLNYTSN